MKKSQTKVKLKSPLELVKELQEEVHNANVKNRVLSEENTAIKDDLKAKKSVIDGLNALIGELEKRCIEKDKQIVSLKIYFGIRAFADKLAAAAKELPPKPNYKSGGMCGGGTAYVGDKCQAELVTPASNFTGFAIKQQPSSPKDQVNAILGRLDISEAVFVLEQVAHHTMQHVIGLRTEANNEKSLFDNLAEKLSKL